jgi:hypothetical protein
MKTLEQHARQLLNEFALSTAQIDSILEKLKTENDAMRGRWHDEASGYPQALVNVLENITLRTAVTWLEENLPQAWMIPALKQCAGIQPLTKED